MSTLVKLSGKHGRTLAAVLADPVNGNLPWAEIEALFRAPGCRVIAGSGPSVTIEKCGARAHFHRPHPARESLRYRVKDAREFLHRIGAAPE
jgi:hypothetical protein